MEIDFYDNYLECLLDRLDSEENSNLIDTSNYHEKVVVTQLESYHPLRGNYFTCSKTENLPKILLALDTLDVELSQQKLEKLVRTVVKREISHISSNSVIYIGVNMQDELTVSSSGYLSSLAERVKILSFDPLLDTRAANSMLIRVETVKLAKRMSEYLGVYMPYLGEDTVFDMTKGISYTKDLITTYYPIYNCPYIIYAHSYLYDMLNYSFFRFRAPEGCVRLEGMVSNRPYLVLDSSVNLSDENLIGSLKIIVYDGNPYNRQDVISPSGDILNNYYRISDLSDEKFFMPVTRGHQRYADYLEGKRRLNSYYRQISDIRHNHRLSERLNNLKIKRDPMENYNTDVETQLLSVSLHKMLCDIPDNKPAKTLLKLNKLGYLKTSTRNVTIRTSDKQMTYLPSGKDTIMTENGNWEPKGRQSGKYGKVLKKILSEQVPRLKYTDRDIELLVNHLKAKVDDGSFSEVTGEDIRHWYHIDNYVYSESKQGTLNNSCMKYDECQSYLDIYTENPDVVKMVVLVKDNKLIGRALVWNNKWMDRIYGTDSTISAFKSYAREKGYHCKSSQNSSPDQGWIDPDTGENYYESVIIDLNANWDEYPYADTFCFLDKDNNQISNDRNRLSSVSGEMRDTGGGLENDDRVYDEVDECYILEDDAVYLNYRDCYTHVDNTCYCEESEEYYLPDDTVRTWNNRIVYEDLAMWSDGNDEYYTESDYYYTCEYSDDVYIEDMTPSVYIQELSMNVAQSNVDKAYKNAGYEQNESGEWVLNED